MPEIKDLLTDTQINALEEYGRDYEEKIKQEGLGFIKLD